jgi:hypothetical protein
MVESMTKLELNNCEMTLWKLPQIDFKIKKQNYYKSGGKAVDEVLE